MRGRVHSPLEPDSLLRRRMEKTVSNAVYRARHREQRSALAPLASMATSATSNVALAGRRSAVVALSSGLVVGIAGVAPASADELPTSAGKIDTAAFTATDSNSRSPLTANAVLTISANAEWAKESGKIKVTPAPKPVVRELPVAASRTSERAPLTSNGGGTTTSNGGGSTATAAKPQAAVPSSVNGNAVLEIASRYVGVPYVYGGSTPSGFDCSGFTSYVYAQLGVSLPRSSSAQRYAGTVVSRSEAKPGDLIWTPGHIAIYAGGNQQIDAPRPGKTIQFRNIWQSNPTFIRVG